MAKTLSDDQLRFTLDINGDPARAEMTRLGNATAKLKQTNKDLNIELQKMAANGKKNTQEYKNLQGKLKENSKAIEANGVKINGLLKNMKLEQLTLKELRKEYSRMKQMRDSSTPNSANWKKADEAMKAYQKRITEVQGSQKSANKVFGLLKQALPIVGVTGLINLFGNLKQRAEETRAVFSKYEAVLKNTLGSQKLANAAFADLQKFAAATPFQLDELTGSYVKLVNQGFKPTMDEMTSLGDIAAAQGKSFDQLTEAIIDAQVGENERLKEFGIRAQKNGDKIKYTFKGVTTEVSNNATEIQKYILSLGKLDGVAGSMEAISKTIGGAKSNLGDSADAFYNAIGKRLEPGLIKLYGTLGKLYGKMADWVKVSPTKEIEDEGKKVNQLVMKLTDANTTEDQRRVILEQLNEINPKIVNGLNAENIEASKLKENLREYNNELSNRIILANLSDEEEKQTAKLAKARTKEGEKILQIQTKILSVNEDIALSTGTTEEKLKKTIEYLNQQVEIQKKTGKAGRISSSGYAQTNSLTDEQKALDVLLILERELLDLTEQRVAAESESEGYAARIEELKKILGITIDIAKNERKTGKDAVDYDQIRKNELESSKKWLIERENQLYGLRKELGLISTAALIAEEIKQLKSRDEFVLLSAEEQQKALFDIYKKYQKDIAITQEEEAYEPEVEADIEWYNKLMAQKQAITEQYAKYSIDELEQIELAEFEKTFNLLAGTEEFEAAKFEIEEKYRLMREEADQQELDRKLSKAKEYLAQYQFISQNGTDIVMGLQQLEQEDLEAQKEKGLISEEEYEKKSKNLKKKYADVEFVATIAQILANTAQGVMQGYANFDPITASILAALPLTAGAIQVGVANKQRQRVKQLAKGKYNVIGEDDGKLYSNVNYTQRLPTGFTSSPVLVGEQPEFVIDHPTVRNIEYNAPYLFDQIQALRVSQHATGKYPDTATNTPVPDIASIINANTLAMQAILTKPITAVARYDDEEARKINKVIETDNEIYAKHTR